MVETKPAFLKRVHIENFKSIRHCDVELQPLTLLVGPNGSGKTNFLDALRFVGEMLKRPPEEVVRVLGGTLGSEEIPVIFRRTLGVEDDIDVRESLAIELELELPLAQKVTYSLKLGPILSIREEQCIITDQSGSSVAHYHVSQGGIISKSLESAPPVFKDRLYLRSVAPFPPFDSVLQSLQAMQFYAIQPESIRRRELTVHDLLNLDGSGLASVLGRIGNARPTVKDRIDDYLRAILPNLRQTLLVPFVGVTSIAGKTGAVSHRLRNEEFAYLSFLFAENGGDGLEFGLASMSDGTLHALGVLVALFQCRDLPAKSVIPLVAIEEPEANLHPGAAEVLMDAMTEATTFTQVMATTHSPDFLDYPDLDPESLLVFDASGGETLVAKADDASMSAIRDRLYSAGELLRLDQLRPRTAGAPK